MKKKIHFVSEFHLQDE
jgi:hypothetical protein